MMVLQPIDWGLITGIATDFAFGYCMYKLYTYGSRYVEDIQKATHLELGTGLEKELEQCTDKTMPYVCIAGVVAPVGNPMISRYSDREGVVQSISLVEHRSKRVVGNTWTDTKHTIRDTSEFIPFLIRGATQPDHQVYVTEPRSAEYLTDNLMTTHDKFDQVNSSVLRRGIDFISGEISKGFHEVERMLLVGTQVIGIGELTLEAGKARLRPPVSGKRYIVTALSKEELINKFKSQSKWAKFFYKMSLVIGSCLLTFLLYRWYTKFRDEQQRRQLLQDVREEHRRARREAAEQRARNGRQQGNPEGGDVIDDQEEQDDDRELCVVCLTNPREVVLISCGHICLCLDCTDLLPTPLLCPVCRARVERFVPYYRP
ncbi:mitochondrial ubiquitin ligase activator of nfkb 1-like [Mizuhopecten yessoensis]|uniref:RING-type E3 ubiquitin transferase n=1 Tax=Mizuhopecten yessoensis TaxID=6573 RepID=A0A210PWU6_MIZYE|nr:mitochondrial ubiquitin ligase activator of nfkb 1-like [Mizuhopecten yessoensis]OWF40960.1 Mitochondrial ubiquitin ligase activator of nfkb 1 [Mizuhopecten yessoensis]